MEVSTRSPSSQSQGGFRSRRSYPSLNQVSLSPLNPRFPIDDDYDDNDTDPADYFTPRREVPDTPTGRTSYLSSFSVPGTPGVLSHSHSRSGSRARLDSRSKSSTRIHSSDTNLQTQGLASLPPHHHHHHRHHHHEASENHNTLSPPSSRRHPPDVHRHSDTEWMLRAGIALASSTREEKGQSWLQQQQPIVPEPRHSRSGHSTPAAYSRRGSRPSSRRPSRPDLLMTSLGSTGTAKPQDPTVTTTAPSSGIGTPSEADHAATRHLVPDFVDERIRAEMEIIQQDEDEDNLSSASDSLFASEDEIDEQELQRLTRERGFGLGSWIDRMVEWTLFGVDDWPLSASATTAPAPASARPADYYHPRHELDIDNIREEEADNISLPDPDSDTASVAEKPGDHGGWEDAGWLFRIVKRALP
ncbi:hypothetical protein BO70DRAFT_428246 [Aspergillus heteromorphus CBS 117.55]|uniref:Uncharacterized protein n=1 Tax=Aspergillus heteromorphus CBS 117.55 TaxID=1448321 RepID=A0A317WI97_9EURO|nr:uncharacterized protein BO70DRAFT_428246 [Aspergillus heteromorphus CBS 117.55]PWY86186.1 hypothetical protein BO70DRAFT_428246 [Aspergillus heteromorphus CBS 117.55]